MGQKVESVAIHRALILEVTEDGIRDIQSLNERNIR